MGHSTAATENSEETSNVNETYLQAAKIQKEQRESKSHEHHPEFGGVLPDDESSESEEEPEELPEHEDYLEEILKDLQWETLIFFITLFILAGELAELRFMMVLTMWCSLTI